MRLLLLVSLVASGTFASTAGAQIASERYYPLEPGDVRVYEYAERSGATCSESETILYERNEVLRDTVVAGEPRSVAACTLLSAEGDRIGRNVYVVHRIFRMGIAADLIAEEAGCRLASNSEVGRSTGEDIDPTVTIGATSYTVAGAFNVSTSFGHGQTFESSSASNYADIGPGLSIHTVERGGASPTCTRRTQTLVYATVGGQTYGANPVASGDAPAASAAFAITASPSPARGVTTVRLAGAVDRPAHVEAFDRIGRRVWSGETRAELRLDVSAWPAGLYVVRATLGGATSSTRLVVQR